MSEAILYEVNQNTANITLNQPDKRNALDAALCALLCEALGKAEADPEVHLVVLRGAGRSFSAGGDIQAMANRSGMFAGNETELAESYRNTIQRIPAFVHTMNTPLLGVIEGSAIGAGFDLACLCDIRIGTNRAFFAESFAGLGLISGFGGAHILTQIMGASRAKEISLTGRRVLAEEAQRLGVLHHLCNEEELSQKVEEISTLVLKNSISALQGMKKLFRSAESQSLPDHLHEASEMQGKLQNLDNHIERVNAMLSKVKSK